MSAGLCSPERNMMGSTYSSSILSVLPVSVEWWLPAEFTLLNFSLAGTLEPLLSPLHAAHAGLNT